MTHSVFAIGSFSVASSRWPRVSFRDLARTAYLGAFSDVGLSDGLANHAAWSCNRISCAWGQAAIRGNTLYIPRVGDGLFPRHAPIVNVKGGGASASPPGQATCKEIRANDADPTPVICVEKMSGANEVDMTDPAGLEMAGAPAPRPKLPGPNRSSGSRSGNFPPSTNTYTSRVDPARPSHRACPTSRTHSTASVLYV